MLNLCLKIIVNPLFIKYFFQHASHFRSRGILRTAREDRRTDPAIHVTIGMPIDRYLRDFLSEHR